MGMRGYLIFFYFLNVFDSCDAGMQLSNWEESKTWKDNILENYQYIVQRFYGISRIRCAGHCDSYSSCESFFYTKSSKFCQLNAVDLKNTGLTPWHVVSSYGTIYYTKSGIAAVTPSSLSTETSPVARPCNGFEYNYNNGKYYTYVSSPVVRVEDADPKCQQIGGQLAQLKTLASIDVAKSIIQTKAAATNDQLNKIAFWLAAKFDPNRTNFYWIHDNELIPTNSPAWFDKQPEMIKGNANNTECVVLIPTYGFTLDDFECIITDGTTLYPLCECV